MKHNAITLRRVSVGLLPWIVFLFFLVLPFLNFSVVTSHQFGDFVEAILHGRFSVPLVGQPLYDLAVFQGKGFLVFGPAPLLLLTPLDALAHLLGTTLSERELQFPLVVAIFFLMRHMALRLKYSRAEALALAMLFCMATPFIGVSMVPIGSYFAHVVGLFFVFVALNEWLGKKRWYIIGMCMAFVLATRLTAGLGIFFFVFDILFQKQNIKKKVSDLAVLLSPLLIVALTLALYNWTRFHSFTETGYIFQILSNPEEYLLRSSGLFAPHHVWNNLWYAFVQPPLVRMTDTSAVHMFFVVPSPWGMSLFITSPYLLYFFFWRKYERVTKIAFATTAIILVPLLLWWSPGFSQYGYRFTLDFLPFVFVAFLLEYKKRHHNLSAWSLCAFIALSIVNFCFALLLFLPV